MKVTVYGIQHEVKWTYKDQSGTNQRLHVIYPEALKAPDAGVRVEALKVSNKVSLDGIKPGDDVEIYYNRFGNIEQVVKV